MDRVIWSVFLLQEYSCFFQYLATVKLGSLLLITYKLKKQVEKGMNYVES